MKVKKIPYRLLSAFVAVCLLLSVSITSVLAQAAPPSITVSDASGSPGDQVDISVDAENISFTKGITVKFTFDASQFSCVESTVNPDLLGNGNLAKVDSSPEKDTVLFYFISSQGAAVGHLFTATFAIKDGAETTSITPTVEVYYNENNVNDPSSVQVSGGQITVTDPTPPDVPVTGLTLDRHEVSLTTGDSDTLVATITPDNATDQTVVWSSSDHTVVAIDGNGNITAMKAGTATITATSANGISDSCVVTVTDPTPPDVPVTGLTLDRHEVNMTTGDSDTLTATITPDNATDKSVAWSSSDSTVVAVDENGNITAMKAGTATITATSANNISDSCVVTVTDPTPPDVPVTDLTLDRHEVNMTTGDSDTLVAAITPDNATDKSVAWSSSDSTVVAVDENGNITALKAGTATITATSANDISDSCVVTVTDPTPPDVPVTDLTLDRHEVNMTTGDSDTLVAAITPDNATDKSVTWSSSDSTVVAVDENGNITALKAGTATITATSANDISDSCVITVTDSSSPVIPVESISLDRHEVDLTVGDSDTLIAAVTPDNATEDVLWASSDESVVTVDQDGNITAVGAGEAIIVAGTENGVYDICFVTVSAQTGGDNVPADSITFDQDEVELTVGESEKLEITISPDNATDKTVAWSSSDESVVTVDENGKITAIKAGTATITVTTSNGLTATCTITVTAAGTGDNPGGSAGGDHNAPQTGDNGPFLEVVVSAAALGAVSLLVLRKRRAA